MYTATVSPMARPRPSIAPPTTPLRPCGITTALIIVQRVAPSAKAAWIRSSGAWANISRETDVMIGMIMIARTTPATNGERVKKYGFTSKRGIQPKYLFISFPQYSTLGIKTKKPQIPKRMEGKAAIMSMTATKIFFIHCGA